MLLYSRKKVRYRRDGYCWKKRKDGKTTREDHMKLKVQGTEVSSSQPQQWDPLSLLTCPIICFAIVHLRLLRPFGHPANLPPAVLLAASKPRHCPRPLSERPLSGRQQDGGHHPEPGALGRQEGVDQGGTGQSTQADV